MIKKFLYFTLILLLFDGCDKIGSFFSEQSLNTIKTTTPESILEWQTDDPGEMVWQVAMDYCQNLTFDSKADWRLPNVDELQTILDRSKFYPATDKTMFPHIHSTYYWSSTTYAYNTDFAWYVNFSHGLVGRYGKSDNFYIRCVRGGQ